MAYGRTAGGGSNKFESVIVVLQSLEVTYEVRSSEDDAAAFAEDLLLEQTFETPLEVVSRYPDLIPRLGGEVLSVRSTGTKTSLVRLRISDETALEDPAQCLNALFGNASIHPGARLVGFEPSQRLLQHYGGPRYGMDGIRRQLNVRHRPLTCTALKPVGLPLKEIVTLCRTFAEGGIDVIKDDHYLADQDSCPFQERVRACADVAREQTERSGKPVWYVPSLSGTPDQVFARYEMAIEAGAGAVMIAPMTVGLPLMHQMVDSDGGLPIMAHPSFSLVSAVSPVVLWGKLFRIFGADAIIFVNAGGRFEYDAESCRLIAATMSAPLGPCQASLPVPAGGISLDTVPEAIRLYGNDIMLLVGGSLLRERDLVSATQRFVESVEENALLSA